MAPRSAWVLVLLLAFPAIDAQASRPASIQVEVTALAVAEDAQATFVGVHATVTAQVLGEGSGQVFVATKPLAQTDMQGSARLASRVAAATLGVAWDEQDYLVTFASDSTVIGGPSAGAVMALALTVALHDLIDPGPTWTLDPGVAATGTINPDGTIGPVGGIPAKAEGAKAAGIRTFLYPAGLDVAATQVDGRVVAVDMAQHCGDLGIACRPAATLADLLQAAAGIDLALPPQPLPDTGAYADVLAPSVAEEVDGLAARVAAVAADARRSGLAPAEEARVQQDADAAQERLDGAQAALADGRYYLAATRSFQGAIAAGRAEDLVAFYDQGRSREVLDGSVARCRDAADQAFALADPLRSTGLNGLYAIGSAQDRAQQADDLAGQAQERARTTTVDGALAAMATASFCRERAGTVDWWAGLHDDFGPGPAVTDLQALARDTVAEAREMAAYAVAVLGAADDTLDRLADAERHLAAGRHDGAVVAAVAAHVAASVAMQTSGGEADVPDAVLDAARQAAARAIDAARTQGIEPMLAVSLVELAQDEADDAVALGHLWNARSLALLAVAQPAAAPSLPGTGSAPPGQGDVLVSVAAWALLALALLVGVMAVLALRRR